MKSGLFLVLAVACLLACLAAANIAAAQTEADKCAAYADQAMTSTPTSTGPVRASNQKAQNYSCMAR
jgi:curli biogenesis system outer membrane secretion channel CsgG